MVIWDGKGEEFQKWRGAKRAIRKHHGADRKFSNNQLREGTHVARIARGRRGWMETLDGNRETAYLRYTWGDSAQGRCVPPSHFAKLKQSPNHHAPMA